MPINIPMDVVRIASSILVTVRTDKLGPRQRTAMQKAVRTGVVTGRSLPARMAISILEHHSMPYVVVGANRLSWNNVKRDEDHFFAQVNVMLAAAELAGSERHEEYKRRRLAIVRNAMEKRETHFYEYLGTAYNARVIRKTKFTRTMPKDYVVPELFTYDLRKGERLL